MDSGTTLMDDLLGVVMVGVSRDELIRVYNATGNPEGKRLEAKYDSIRASFVASDTASSVVATERLNALDPAAVRQTMIRVAHDRNNIRGWRWEGVYVLGITPCANPQELVFGPAADARDTYAWAQQRLARYPSERAMLEVIFTRSERPGHQGVSGAGRKLLVGAADVVGFVLRNRRIPGCARTLLGAL